ncbi:RNA 2',3'-cyclic phosphodiesterase [Sediminivirga luteola]|uniref:RNA 2',3'-cyclic phosphodiesterase n=1 Tax=Sediminivirga luteola TaxID=1774748 RepID=A0A8J2TYJ3_9MICO|nr:RNA 2',3'-cyclic phosphodiesterase [Sediminivirga luteola]MCI2264801.1 RNA 2',3'-cyclic phosphodiesterase [Sediminivirga luteola]GGA16332.1 RNA 2',3'-cyclic phosphodiesterase [Sediminivirga luteola]
MRLFASLPLPREVAAHLQLVAGPLADVGGFAASRGRPAVRWVPAEQRHITLAFYGEVPDGAAGDLLAALDRELTAHPPLRLRVRGAGVFSGRTLWAGVQEENGRRHSSPDSALIRLMTACEETGGRIAAGTAEGRERRKAHITLARARDRRAAEPVLRSHASALSVYEGPAWTADRVLVMRSDLGAGKGGTALHTELASIPLGHAGDPR